MMMTPADDTSFDFGESFPVLFSNACDTCMLMHFTQMSRELLK